MTTLNRLTIFIPALTGLLGLALPFKAGVSPLNAITDLLGSAWVRGLLAMPMFLVIPIALLQVHRLVAERMTQVEVVLSFMFSAVAVVPILVLSLWGGWEMFHSLLEPWIYRVWVFIVWNLSSWGFAVINLLLLVRNLAKRLPREVTAEVFLLGGYFPNAVCCLVVFYAGAWRLEVGAYLVLATCIGYLIRIVLLLWRRGDDAPRSNAPLGEPAHAPYPNQQASSGDSQWRLTVKSYHLTSGPSIIPGPER